MLWNINDSFDFDLNYFSIKNDINNLNEEDELSSIKGIKSVVQESKEFHNFFSTFETKRINDDDSEIKHMMFTTKKRKKIKKKIFEFKKEKRFRDINNNNINIKKKCGRINKNLPKNGLHDKFAEDNMIKKIKAFFFNNYLPNVVNNNVKDKTYFIKKIEGEFIDKIKSKDNLDLLDTIYADVLKSEKITTKNKKSESDKNKKIVLRIFKEKEQSKVMKILNLRVGELFEIFRRKLFDNNENLTNELIKKIKDLDLLNDYNSDKYKDFYYLINNLKEEDEMTLEKFIEYREKLINLCKNYENWFKKRINEKKKKK